MVRMSESNVYPLKHVCKEQVDKKIKLSSFVQAREDGKDITNVQDITDRSFYPWGCLR